MRRGKTTVAPDAPQKQIAWTHQIKHVEMAGSSLGHQDMAGHQVYKAVPVMEASNCGSEPSPIRPIDNHNPALMESGPTTSTPEESSRGLPSRTYRSLKEMVTRGFTSQKSTGGPDTSLSPQSQLRQAGIYLQPQPQPQPPVSQPQLRPGHHQPQVQQHHHQPLQPPLNSNDGYRVYPIGGYTETPRRDVTKAQSHDNLLSQDNRFRQESGLSGGNSCQTIYMQQQEQRVMYGTAGPSRPQYPYTNQQQPDNRLGYPDPIRNASHFPGQGQFNYSQEQQRRHFAEQQRHNELQQQRLLGERMAGEGQAVQQRSGGLEGGGGGHQTHQTHQHSQQHQGGPRQGEPPILQNHYLDQQRLTGHDQPKHPEQTPGGTYNEIRRNNINSENQWQSNDQKHQKEHQSKEPKQPCDPLPQENGTSQDDPLKNPNKLDIPNKPSSPEDDDEGGFVKRGAQSDSGRGSTVYSSVKAKPGLTNGEKGEEWSERVETELRQILTGSGGSSESLSSVSPPLPPLSPPASSGEERPKYTLNSNSLGLSGGFKSQGGPLWVTRTGDKTGRSHHKNSKSASNLLSSRLDIDSILDDNNSSDEELDYADTRLIRKQLEGLENMYGQVLKLLKARKQNSTYDGLEPGLRNTRRRTCGSVSSVPSSVSSRPIRNTRSQQRGKIRDFKGINKRFQRLESHVVTLARSVAHLSSEMRTQHLMMQELEVMRGELASLKVHSNQHHHQQSQLLMTSMRGAQGHSTTPDKVKRLTKFFGDEPPLLRLFLRGLGYEKYANLFEKERIGLLELPYLTEERLQKLGIPLGPRLRILQQAHLANPNTLAIL